MPMPRLGNMEPALRGREPAAVLRPWALPGRCRPAAAAAAAADERPNPAAAAPTAARFPAEPAEARPAAAWGRAAGAVLPGPGRDRAACDCVSWCCAAAMAAAADGPLPP
jgi:hypothetical protein